MLSFVKCSSAHLPAVRTFWAQAYGPRHILGTDRALFDWQFGSGAGGRTPSHLASDKYHMHLALDDEKVVGCLGFIPTEVTVRGTVVRGCWLANWIVLPETARLGLGPLLLRETLRDIDVVVNVGISAEARHLLSRLGWLNLGTLSRWVCPLDIATTEQLLPLDATGTWPAAPARDALPPAFTIQQVAEFGEEAEQLWDAEWGADGAGTRRSAQLLNWRYAAHPAFHYQLLDLREGGALVGFAVYRSEAVRDLPVRVGRIVELVVNPGAASVLINALCEHASAQGIAALDFFCSSTRLDGALQLAGFQRGDAGRASSLPYLFQPVDRNRSEIACMIYPSNIDVPNSSDDWYTTKGDADQDRPN